MRMPLPPPPINALIMTGRPNSSANALASCAVSSALSVPGTTGTFAAMAIFRAETLSEKESKFSTVGPTNVMPRSLHNRASSGDSDKKP